MTPTEPTPQPYLADTRPLDDAALLLARFGEAAANEADARAKRARALGNYLHFCRWRQVGRLLAVLGTERAIGALH